MMRASIKIGLVMLTACLVSGSLLAQSATETSDFETVQRLGSRQAYETFLKTYPTGPYADRTRDLIANLPDNEQIKRDFELVEKIGTRKAYEAFLQTHKTGDYADLARKRIHDQRTGKPNWGDEIFVPKLMQK